MIRNFKDFFNILPIKTKKNFWLIVLYQIFKFILEMISIGVLIPVIYIIINGQKEFLDKIESYLSLPIVSNLSSMSNEKFILLFISVITLIFFLKFILLSLINYFEQTWVEYGKLNLSRELFKNYVFDFRNFSERKSNEMFRNVSIMPQTLFKFFVQGFYIFLGDIFKFIGFTIVLYSINVKAFLISATIITILVLIVLIFIKPKVNFLGKELILNDGFYIKYINEGLSSSKEIFLSKNPIFFIEKFYLYGKRRAHNYISTNLYTFIPKQLIELFGIVLLCLIVYFLKFNSDMNEDTIFILGSFVAIFSRLLPLGNNIYYNIKQMIFGLPSLKVLNYQIGIKRNFESLFDSKKPFKDPLKKIKIENLNFKYPNSDNFVLKDMNLELNAGNTYCIYGASGSGKTTFLNVLMNFLTPSSGKILVNNDNNKLNELNIFNKISYLSQKIFLLNDTVTKNIAFSEDEDEIDYTKVQKCLNLANLTNEIKDMNFLVGEDGSFLSGGQKQRIGIARALYFDKELLILDEITSSLDSKNENIIIDNLNKIKKDKIIILCSHSKNVIDQCDYKIELTASV